MSARYREIEITGSPLEMGRQLGEAAREEVRGFADVALERVNKTISISRNAALEVARQSAACVESYAPHMLQKSYAALHRVLACLLTISCCCKCATNSNPKKTLDARPSRPLL